MTERFVRMEQLLGPEALARLRGSRVAVLGLGAVGSYALEALARTGIGDLVLVDFDEVRPSNFNRQLLAVESALGRRKVDAARERVLAINPACRVTLYPEFVLTDTLPRLLAERPDVVVDAIDSLGPKSALIAYCVAQGLPFISSLGAGAKLDPSAIRVGDLSEVTVCPFGKRLRSRLKNKGVTSGVRCVYSIERPRRPLAPPAQEEETVSRGRPRIPVGTISYLTGMFGLYTACEALRLLLPASFAEVPEGARSCVSPVSVKTEE